MDSRVLIISPVRDEAEHIEQVARSVQHQTRPPHLWLVVDDGSTDGTGDKLRELAEEIPFLRTLTRPPEAEGPLDRLAAAAEVRAFNWALEQLNDLSAYTHIGKLDGDVELPADYFAQLLERFESDPRLGLAGGNLVESHDGRWKRIAIPITHVHGALKLYRRECFEAIGGLSPSLGWDSIDQVYARMSGWNARSFPEVVAVHHRHWGSAQGLLRGRARHGTCAWISHQPIGWVALRACKLATSRPYGLSGAAFIAGYFSAAARSTPRVDDDRFRRFVRHELRSRVAARALPRRVARSRAEAR